MPTSSPTGAICLRAGNIRQQLADRVRDNDQPSVILAYYEHLWRGGGVLPIAHPDMYKSCMKMLGDFAKSGDVLSVGTDGDAPVCLPGGVTLWPIFVCLKGVPCVQNLLLTGGPGDATPYLFAKKQNRDNVLAWLQRKMARA